MISRQAQTFGYVCSFEWEKPIRGKQKQTEFATRSLFEKIVAPK